MLKKDILRLICEKSGILYILFSKNFKILDFDKNINEVANNTEHLTIGSDIRESFWEFIGIEDPILNLLNNDENSFELNMIFKNELYYNLEIKSILSSDSNDIFIAFITKKANFSTQYLKTIQELNKKTLLLETNKEQENHLYELINQNILSFHVDMDGIITEVNSVCTYFFANDESNIIGHHFSKFFHSRETILEYNQSKLFNATNASGESIFFHADIIPVQYDGVITKNIIMCQDITHLKKIEQELEYAANHDSLTGLANRSNLLKKIDIAIKTSTENDTSFSICFIDLDKFKPINDNYGHHAGDMLLKHISSLLRNFVRECDTVSRIGGDEFIILFTDLENQEYLKFAIQRINELAKQKPLIYNEDDIIEFSFSLGTSSFPEHGKDAKTLLDYADKEMYKIKKIR